MKKIGFALIASVVVTGCGSDIDKVKNSRSPFNEIYVIKDIFDTRKSCSKINWMEFKSDKGVNVVEYTCDVDMAHEIASHEKLVRSSKEKALEIYNEIQNSNSKSLKEALELIAKYKLELAKSIEEHGQVGYVSMEHEKYEISQKQKYLLDMIEINESVKNDSERFLKRTLEDIEKVTYSSSKASSIFMYSQARAQYKLVAQFTLNDDEKTSRILYVGEESITVDGERLTRAIEPIKFFSDMEQDKIITIK